MQKKILLGSIFLLCVLLLVVSFPKTIYKEKDTSITSCDCFGSEFWFGTRCVGFPVHCSSTSVPVIETSCSQPSCEEIFSQLTVKNKVLSSKLQSESSTDVVLVIDASNSMEGARLLSAKEAANRLITSIDDNEQVAIISFSENASIVHSFSSDKKSLLKEIGNISVSGGTNYLPALLAAQEIFANHVSTGKKGLIFLSDGIPSDSSVEILNKTASLQKKGITVYTINFGIAKEESESNILEKMSSSVESSDSSKLHKSFSESENITDAFYDAWQEISQLDSLTISLFSEESVFSSSSLSSTGVTVSLDELLLVNSSFVQESICVPDLSVKGFANSSSSSFNFSFVPSEENFLFPKEVFTPGAYDVSVVASFSSFGNQSCTFTGDSSFSFLITEENACRSLSCEEVTELLEDFDLAVLSGARIARDTYHQARIAILLDTSESMISEQRDVLLGVDRLNRLLSLSDLRALITFSQDAQLVVPFTRNKDEISEALASIVPHGTTKLLPALTKTRFLFERNSFGADVAVIMTDGFAYDNEGQEGIFSAAKELVDANVCVYIIGYGSALLRDTDQIRFLRKIGDYSSKKTDCGGYFFTPNSEQLSSLVTSMFGGSLISEDPLRIIVDKIKGNGSVGSVSFSIETVSMKTGLQFPVVVDSSCLPVPLMDVSLSFKNGKEVPLKIVTLPSGVVKAHSDYLFPGRYVLRVSSSLPVDGCSFTQTHEEEFVIFGPPPYNSENVISLSIVLLLSCIFFLIWKLKK